MEQVSKCKSQINEPLINGSLCKSQFKSISSRLAVKSLFNYKFDFESTAPGKTDPTRVDTVLKSTQVDLLGSTPRSTQHTLPLSCSCCCYLFFSRVLLQH